MSDEKIETKFSVHEAICAQRYEGIQERLADGSRRMKNIELMLYVVIACVLLGPGVAAVFIKKLFGI